jgi:hypothetical protein
LTSVHRNNKSLKKSPEQALHILAYFIPGLAQRKTPMPPGVIRLFVFGEVIRTPTFSHGIGQKRATCFPGCESRISGLTCCFRSVQKGDPGPQKPGLSVFHWA